ncbi:P-loop NTPase [Sphingomonas jatrophae]|uniref:Exopolysaccharide/PEP-CTERM locus tyrosine autokinase n=1 Tax=Sphingomonas jatrophae TaxID=1166337 RepID=A0A1I6JWV8_9SPHN|nr:P-loop NTPase [Sphingomonas jatrophae]SFR83426.1 exopolysaccharide/PEP-CTERM locus tyrosine autokinase [Sphingomonas jatrophae]
MTDSPARSLLERAARAFDFEAAARAHALPVAEDAPATVVEPEGGWRRAAARRGTIPRDLLETQGFILPDAIPSALAEEMRIVKRQLLLAAGAPGATARDRMVLIASAREGEGKTFCAANLALSLASERDWEVLLVDADVARPSVPRVLGLEEGPGLLDALADPHVDVEGCIVRTDIGALSVLPAGQPVPNATELIASDRMGSLLERLSSRSDRRLIIFDSPPALAASPAAALALHVGQTLLVVRADSTGEAELKEAVGLLSACPRLQLLLNAVTYHGGTRRFGGYYGKDA